MQPSSFFNTEQDPAWSMNGDPWSSFREIFDLPLVESISRGPIDQGNDLEVAQALTRLVQDELRRYGTDGSQQLSEDEMAVAMRGLRAVLGRLGITFSLPFRDFAGFRDYWSSEGMSGGGGWAARRGYVSELFSPVWTQIDERELAVAGGSVRGVDGEVKNIIFASTGPKPEIVLRDAVNNVIEIVEHEEHCLIYDRPLGRTGLTWGDLAVWWGETHGADPAALPDVPTARALYKRLEESLGDNPAERVLFRTYCERYRGEAGFDAPALLPQVYLHFDPFTARERQKLRKPDRLPRERMGFLLLLPDGKRIVIEVDGQQHYADDGGRASPRQYSAMVAEDRGLRLQGYEVFRFGGYELMQSDAPEMLREFVDALYAVHGIDVRSG